MNQKQVKHEIELMWRQLRNHDAVREKDYKSGLAVRLSNVTHTFGTYRELHAFLTGAYDLLNYLVYVTSKGVSDGKEEEDGRVH